MADDTPEVRIRRLVPGDDRSRFRCENVDLERFFRRYAGQNQFRHHIGTTYVALAGGMIGGFVTVTVGELSAEDIRPVTRDRLPAYPIPVLRIARLAVDDRCRGMGIGKLLLRSMLNLAIELRDRVGCCGVVVDAKADAVAFYARFGFRALETVAGELGDRPQPQPLFLPMQTLIRAGNAPA